MGKIQKEVQMGFTRIVCIDYLKSFNHLHFVVFSSQKEAIFILNFISNWWWKMDLL